MCPGSMLCCAVLSCAVQDRVTGDIITDHKAIALRYLSGWFMVDLLATFPVDYIVRAVEVRDSAKRWKRQLHTLA